MPLLWLKWHQIDSKRPTHAQGNYGGRQVVENIKFFGGEGGIRIVKTLQTVVDPSPWTATRRL